MKQLANHVSLFASHDDTGYLTKYADPVLGLGSKLIQSKDWI